MREVNLIRRGWYADPGGRAVNIRGLLEHPISCVQRPRDSERPLAKPNTQLRGVGACSEEILLGIGEGVRGNRNRVAGRIASVAPGIKERSAARTGDEGGEKSHCEERTKGSSQFETIHVIVRPGAVDC